MINVLVLNKLKEMATLSHGIGLGEVDRAEICQELSKLTGRKRKTQSKYSDEDRYTIAKYAKDNGASQAAKFSKRKYPRINPLCEHLSRSMTKTWKLQKLKVDHLIGN